VLPQRRPLRRSPADHREGQRRRVAAWSDDRNCRGEADARRPDVAGGGTLIQDIASQTSNAIKHEQGAPRDRPSHNVRLAKESLLSSLAQDEKAFVNSHHHQAIDKVGRDLIATAWASDGLIEAIEDPRPDSFVVGVQWHPELGWQVDRLSQALFNHFIAATKEYVNRAGKTSVEMETESVAEGAPANA